MIYDLNKIDRCIFNKTHTRERGERSRQTEKDEQTDRQTGRERYRESVRQTDRQTDRQQSRTNDHSVKTTNPQNSLIRRMKKPTMLTDSIMLALLLPSDS